MALLGLHPYKDYEVTIKHGDNIIIENVVAKDAEQAAWNALELTIHQPSELLNVRLKDAW